MRSICFATLLGLSLQPQVVSQTYSDPVRICTVSDGRIREASGITPSLLYPGVFWIHNDSGDSPRLFAVGSDGVVIAGWPSPTAAVDWRSSRVRARATPYLIGDTGNNGLGRTDLRVYRIGSAPRSLAKLTSAPAMKLRFTYPDGKFDCEGLAVHPVTGQVYLRQEDGAVGRLPLMSLLTTASTTPRAVGTRTCRASTGPPSRPAACASRSHLRRCTGPGELSSGRSQRSPPRRGSRRRPERRAGRRYAFDGAPSTRQRGPASPSPSASSHPPWCSIACPTLAGDRAGERRPPGALAGLFLRRANDDGSIDAADASTSSRNFSCRALMRRRSRR